jgi:hypothetical protein
MFAKPEDTTTTPSGSPSSWTHRGLLGAPTVVEKQAALERLKAAQGPPWRPIPSRDIKKFLGVSLQALANWRVRGTGPPPEPMEKGLGNRIYYRPDKIMAWL